MSNLENSQSLMKLSMSVGLYISKLIGIIRHTLYVSYIFILLGVSLTLLTYWLLIPTLFVIIGIYPTAKAEEELLIEQFGEEYIKYKQKVGMFFPKFGG